MGENNLILTLDAGGTNFAFIAIENGKIIDEPILKKSVIDDLSFCLQTIIEGFTQLIKKVGKKPRAISFAFPGPADYINGVIGDLGNLPCFRGGVALGPLLEEHFRVPVFINNDGDLFTYGEARAGLLLELNNILKKKGIPKEYKSLFGITLGTGLGGGIVIDNKLCRGENSAAAEIWLLRNFENIETTAEEGVSIRAIKKYYSDLSGEVQELSPLEIYEIAKKRRSGNTAAALQAYKMLGKVLAESIANIITILDCPIVIGGGICGAADLILPEILLNLNGEIIGQNGQKIPRLISKVYNVGESFPEEFIKEQGVSVDVPFKNKMATYNLRKRNFLGISFLGTNRAVGLGAYYYAIDNL
ncbi:ROK family protein [Zunongwangia profunda]|uniref:ROK family protein n=1 Tax=Zunongwangia profunda TaxID=398743 RepID=UPI001D18A04E|nr:ROK family protein [Zunongwangia profunda]MCC4226810.1 ROK family protein [Zunongwangia profunda]